MFRAALISMFLTSTALADTWTVDDDGKADFDNIQDAIDAAIWCIFIFCVFKIASSVLASKVRVLSRALMEIDYYGHGPHAATIKSKSVTLTTSS